MVKKILKLGLSKVADFIPYKTKVESINAEGILQQWSPMPCGCCYTQNNIALGYDLQIIIPVYNVENFIQQCVDSVITQVTHYRVLMTVINDGSTDNTNVILAGLSDNREVKIEIISQENKGISGARNAGMQVIKGKYVMFLDSDDVLPKNAIENMMRTAIETDADILQGSWYTFCGDNRKEHILDQEGILTDNRTVFSGFPWGKLYKYTVLEHFQFPEGYWFEDTPVSFILAAMPYRCIGIKDIIYGYRLNPKGITATAAHGKKSVDSYWITEQCLREFPLFGLKYDHRAYEYLLRQSVMNERRTKKQPRRVRKAEFVLTVSLIDKYFKRFQTENPAMEKIESALQNRQFVRFELLIMGM